MTHLCLQDGNQIVQKGSLNPWARIKTWCPRIKSLLIMYSLLKPSKVLSRLVQLMGSTCLGRILTLCLSEIRAMRKHTRTSECLYDHVELSLFFHSYDYQRRLIIQITAETESPESNSSSKSNQSTQLTIKIGVEINHISKVKWPWNSSVCVNKLVAEGKAHAWANLALIATTLTKQSGWPDLTGFRSCWWTR